MINPKLQPPSPLSPLFSSFLNHFPQVYVLPFPPSPTSLPFSLYFFLLPLLSPINNIPFLLTTAISSPPSSLYPPSFSLSSFLSSLLLHSLPFFPLHPFPFLFFLPLSFYYRVVFCEENYLKSLVVYRVFSVHG